MHLLNRGFLSVWFGVLCMCADGWGGKKKAHFRAPSAGETIKVAPKKRCRLMKERFALFKTHKTRVGVSACETTRGSGCSRMTFSHSSKRVIEATTKRLYVGEHKGSGARAGGNIFTSWHKDWNNLKSAWIQKKNQGFTLIRGVTRAYFCTFVQWTDLTRWS